MSLSFQEMLRFETANPLQSEDEAGAQHLLERLKRLREPGRLPNLRVCQVVGAKVCLRSCDPFGMEAAGAAELLGLGLRSVIDLRADHERAEGDNAPLYSELRVLRWHADSGDFTEEAPSNPDAALTAYRVDCMRSPQAQLRRFLCADYAGPSRLHSVPDVSAYLLPVAGDRPPHRLLRDLLDCFPDALAAAFRVLAQPDAYPVLLASRDGQGPAALVSCLLQLTLGEDPSIIADMHAASEVDFLRSQDQSLSQEQQNSRVKESRKTMLGFCDYIQSAYRTAENYLLKAGLSQQEIRQLKTV